MVLKIQTVDESIESNGIKVLTYGLLGSGKTRLCATPAAHNEPVLLINVEGGLLSLKNIPESQKKNISVASAKSFGDIEEIYEHLIQEHRYSWVCVDSISDVAEVVLTNEKATQNDGRAAYGNLADIMMGMLRAFRDIPNYNVLMTAKMTRFTDEITNRTMYWPLMPGKTLTNGIGYLFDEVFALRVEEDSEGNQTRWLQTARDIQYEAKDRSAILNEFEEPDLYNIALKINNATPLDDESTNVDTSTKETTKKENKNGTNA